MLLELGIHKGEKYPEELLLVDLTEENRRCALKHCRALLEDIPGFIDQGEMNKVYRHLGFVQGVFFASGMCSVGRLKEMNRRDPGVTGESETLFSTSSTRGISPSA